MAKKQEKETHKRERGHEGERSQQRGQSQEGATKSQEGATKEKGREGEGARGRGNTGKSKETRSGPTTGGSKVNLNTASEQELRKMAGLGEQHARQLIRYREKHGELQDFSDLENVEGFDGQLIETIRRQAVI